MAPLDRFLLALHLCLSSLPSVDPQHPLEAARSLLNNEIPGKPPKSKSKSKGKMKASPPSTPISVPYPLPLPSEDANWKVAFEKPADVFLVGSWANKVSVKAKDGEPWSVDVAVEMPSVRQLFINFHETLINDAEPIPRKRLPERTLFSQKSVLLGCLG